MISLSYIFRFLQHYLKANTLHGTHSPFVYDLLENVIYKKTESNKYNDIENERKKLLSDHSILTIKDLGAGSIMQSVLKRKVSSIAKTSLKSKKLANLLARIFEHFQPKNSIELGTSFGITTAYFAKANTQNNTITIEGCEEIAAVANQVFLNLNLKNIEIEIGNIDNVFPSILKKLSKVDFIYFDGNHTEEATINYFKNAIPYISEGTIFIFDDIYWSQGMMNAWQKIKANSDVTVTIDLFHFGIVFFRKGQVKEDFLVRLKN